MGLFVQARIFQGDSEKRRESGEHAFVFGGKGVRLCAFEVHDADKAVLAQEGDDEFGTGVDAGFATNVARIGEDVVDAHGGALASGRTSQPFVEAHTETRRKGLFIAIGKDGLEQLRIFVPDHHAEDFVVDEAFDPFGDGAKQNGVADVGREVAADILQEGEGSGLFGGTDEQGGRQGVGVPEGAEELAFGDVIHDLAVCPNYLFDAIEGRKSRVFAGGGVICYWEAEDIAFE